MDRGHPRDQRQVEVAYQLHSTIEPGADPRKYHIGQRLRVTGCSDEAVPHRFDIGDEVTVLPVNGCGMGIDVIGPEGGPDMIWPDEVEILTRGSESEALA